MTREDLQRQHDELLTATRDEYNQHISQLQHSVKVCVEDDSDNILPRTITLKSSFTYM